MTKRSKFVTVAVVVAVVMWLLEYFSIDARMQAVVAVVTLTYVLAGWALFEDLKGIEWITVLSLPVLYTLGAGLFSFFLPNHIARLGELRLEADVAVLLANVVRVGYWGLFGVGMYAVMLTENIFSVAAIRTIQLLRAAHAVGFLITLVVGLFLYNSIFSFKLSWWMNGLLVAILSWPVVLQGVWYMELRDVVSRQVWRVSLVVGMILGQLAVVLSFWPVRAITAALGLTTALYVLLGLAQQHVIGRLFKNQIKEYVMVGVVVMVATFLVTSWR